MVLDNVEFKSDFDSMVTPDRRVSSNQIRTKQSTFASIKKRWREFRLGMLRDQLERAKTDLVTGEYAAKSSGLTPGAQATLDRRANVIARLEEKIMIRSREDVPNNYIRHRAIKLRQKMRENLEYNSGLAYSVKPENYDKVFANDMPVQEEVPFTVPSVDTGLAAVADTSSIDVQEMQARNEKSLVSEVNRAMENPIDRDAIQGVIDSEFDSVMGEEVTDSEVEATPVENVETSISREEIQKVVDEEYRKIDPEQTVTEISPEEVAQTVNDIVAPATTVDYAGLKDAVDAALAGVRVTKNESAPVRRTYNYVPMTDEEIARARENIEYDKYEKLYADQWASIKQKFVDKEMADQWDAIRKHFREKELSDAWDDVRKHFHDKEISDEWDRIRQHFAANDLSSQWDEVRQNATSADTDAQWEAIRRRFINSDMDSQWEAIRRHFLDKENSDAWEAIRKHFLDKEISDEWDRIRDHFYQKGLSDQWSSIVDSFLRKEVPDIQIEQAASNNATREEVVVVPEREVPVQQYTTQPQEAVEEYTFVPNDQDLHFDYSQATKKEVARAASYESSRIGLASLKERALKLKEEHKKSQLDLTAARDEQTDEARKALEVREANKAKKQSYEDSLRKLQEFCQALEEETIININSAALARNDVLCNRRFIESQTAEMHDYDDKMREIDSIIEDTEEAKRR